MPTWYKPWTWNDSSSATAKRADQNETGQAANQFAEWAQGGAMSMTAEAERARRALERQASGQDSLSAEQLRQGLARNMAAQRSAAASASPANGPMAALMAQQQMGRMGAGMSGQAAQAGIQERQAAQQALAQLIMQQRQQDMQAALGSRGNAIGAYGGVTPEAGMLDKLAPLFSVGQGVASLMAGGKK